MTGIILVGHGNFATGLSSAANLIFGELEKFEALDFTIDTTPEILERKIEEKIKEFGNNNGILIFSDIAGGTPFKVSSLASLKYSNVKVFAGTNLPLLLEVLSEREGYKDLDLIMEYLVNLGREEINFFKVNNKKNQSEEIEDSI